VKYFLWVKVIKCHKCEDDVDLFPGYLIAGDSRHPKNVFICPVCGNCRRSATEKHLAPVVIAVQVCLRMVLRSGIFVHALNVGHRIVSEPKLGPPAIDYLRLSITAPLAGKTMSVGISRHLTLMTSREFKKPSKNGRKCAPTMSG